MKLHDLGFPWIRSLCHTHSDCLPDRPGVPSMMPEVSTKPLTPQEILKECKRLGNAGEPATAANLLKDALRRGLLDPPRVETAGRLLKALLPRFEDNLRNVRILGHAQRPG